MNRAGKASTFFLVVLLILFSFAMLGAGAFLWISYDKEKKHAVELTAQLEALREEKDKIQRSLDDTNKEKVLLEKKVKEGENALFQLNEKLSAETEAKLTLRNEREELLNRIMALNLENDNVKVLLEEKSKKVEQLEKDLQSVTAQQAKLRQPSAAGTGSAGAEQPTSVTGEKLETIVVSPTGPTAVSAEGESEGAPAQAEEITSGEAVPEGAAEAGTPTPLAANVLLVNREHAFLIIDAGTDNGVKIGDVFDVFHDNELIGKVEVEKVHDTLSAANFLANFKVDLVTTSDVVKRTAK